MKELVIRLGKDIRSTSVELDGKSVGWIQSIKIEVDVKAPTPKVEIIFPDVRQYELNGNPKTTIAMWTEMLNELPYVTVKLQSLSEIASVESPEGKSWASNNEIVDPSELAKWDDELANE